MTANTLTPEKLRALEATCPTWCENEHSWSAEADWSDAGRWPHYRQVGSFLVGYAADRDGIAYKPLLSADSWDWFDDDATAPGENFEAAAVTLEKAAEEALAAAAFIRAAATAAASA